VIWNVCVSAVSTMNALAAALLVSVAESGPCLCIFDVDSTLISWSSTDKCPTIQHSGVFGGSDEVMRAEGEYRLSESFCSQCYMGSISAGGANYADGEREDVVKMLKQGGKLTTSKWTSGCHDKGSSPLVTSCSTKQKAVPGIKKYYEDSEGVQIADSDVHFYDDQPYNIVVFEGTGYNAKQVSCGSTGGTTGGYDGGESNKCAASLDEVNNSPGIKFCCSGSQVSPASGSSKTTQCGTPCHFPFKYSGKTYHDCISEGDVAPWCATKSSYDSTNWGYCHSGSMSVNQTDVMV